MLQTPGIAWYSLQTGDRSQDLAQLPLGIRVQDLSPYLHDFGNTALLLDQLDPVAGLTPAGAAGAATAVAAAPDRCSAHAGSGAATRPGSHNPGRRLLYADRCHYGSEHQHE